MKKISILLVLAFIISLFIPNTARADIGPKPSVVINFKGLEGRTYYATLLANVESTGPFSVYKYNEYTYTHYQEGDEDYDIFLKFVEYQEEEGFYFLQYFKNCTETQQFRWTYYPPQVFKILLYFPDSDSFIVSNQVYERYAFDSYFTAELSGSNLIAVKSYDYKNETLSLIARIVLTIIVELIIALLFGFREKKQFAFILLINIITQIALNVTLNVINYELGTLAFMFFYILLEIAVLIIEWVLYSWYMKKRSQKEVPRWKPGIYALTANATSFLLGLGLAYWIPGIF